MAECDQPQSQTATCCCGALSVDAREVDAPRVCTTCGAWLVRERRRGAVLVVRCLCHEATGAPPQQAPAGNTKWTAPPHWVQCKECKCFSHGSCYQRFNHTTPGGLTINGTLLAAKGFACAFCKKAKNVNYGCTLCRCFRTTKLSDIKVHSREWHRRIGATAPRTWRAMTPAEVRKCPQCNFTNNVYQVNAHFELKHRTTQTTQLPTAATHHQPLAGAKRASSAALPAPVAKRTPQPPPEVEAPPDAREASNGQESAAPSAVDEESASAPTSAATTSAVHVQMGQIVGVISTDERTFRLGSTTDVLPERTWLFERASQAQKALERIKDIADRVTVTCEDQCAVCFISKNGGVKCTLAPACDELTIADGAHEGQRFPANALHDLLFVVKRVVLLIQKLN